MNGINIKKWAKASVATLWPNLFRWSHWPIVIRRRSAAPRSVLLGRDMYLESRESPTTIWRLDPIVAAAISSGLMGELTRQLPASVGGMLSRQSGDVGASSLLTGREVAQATRMARRLESDTSTVRVGGEATAGARSTSTAFSSRQTPS